MLLVIDNYDSFAHNLARYFALAGWRYEVVRNDEITLAEIAAMAPTAIALSPGPCTPAEAGICVEAVRRFGALTPILGVCLGHQAIAQGYGGETVRAPAPVHGKPSEISHNESLLFKDIPNPMVVGRYHSLTTTLPNESALEITARCGDEIMALQHKTHPVYGVQFHPESVLTEHGHQMIENFTALATAWHGQNRRVA